MKTSGLETTTGFKLFLSSRDGKILLETTWRITTGRLRLLTMQRPSGNIPEVSHATK